MKRLKYISMVLAFLMCSIEVPSNMVFAEETSIDTIDSNQVYLVDSNIDYTESTETIENPCAGYTSTIWYTCKPNDTPVYNPTGNLVLMFIDIGAFSSGVNGSTGDDGIYTEGTDYNLDETFFNNLRATLQNCRDNGCTIALRFRYDSNGKTNPEPSTFDKVLEHIQQIKDNGILQDYKDILCYVETGFVGAWGEQHSGKYTSLEYKAQLLQAMLDCVPKEIPVTVRTPNTFAKWAGIEMQDLNDYISTGDALRVGMYNDGYMGSDSDLGTFMYNREEETNWLARQTLHTYYGGEFSGNLEWTQKFDTYLPENAIPEMYKTHLSYINSNIYKLYQDYIFSEEYDIQNVDNSAYYGQTVYKFIRDHLGYRFVLRDSKLSEQVSQGDILNLQFDIENTGFASLLKEPSTVDIILEKDGNYIETSVNINPMEWYSCTTNTESLSLKIPASLDVGSWNVYLKISVGNQELSNSYMRSVRFANSDVWNTSLGANYLGSFEVIQSESISIDNTFYQENIENPVVNNAQPLTYNGKIILDGMLSSDCEWEESSLYAQLDNNELYISNDDENLYIMAKIVQDAVSPVYNLSIKNATNGESYWLYYQSNGFVYFNHGDYSGCVCKYVGDYVEFKIPFGEVMELYPNTELSLVSVNIQDSSQDGWPSVGRVTYENTYTILKDFYVYSSYREVNLSKGSRFVMNVETSNESETYQWYLDGNAIQGANYKEYIIPSALENNVGTYSVRVTSADGVEKVVDICKVLSVVDSYNALGDINNDGTLNTLDLLLLKKHILNITPLSLDMLPNANLNSDSSIDILDLLLLKNIYLTK